MIPVDPPPVHKPIFLRREQIIVDDTRNVRNFGRPIDPKDPETVKLVKLIARDGQLKPVSVIEAPHLRRGHPDAYVLDTGFRRMCAMTILEFEEVSCVVVSADESEVQRIGRVVGENEGHKPLHPAELAYACALIRKAHLDGGEPATIEVVAEKIGRSPGYCKELLVCYDHLIPPILAAWKGETAMRLPTDQAIRFAHMGKARQAEAWEAFLRAEKRLGPGKKKRTGPRPCPRTEVEMLHERSRALVSVLIDGRYETVKGRAQLRLVRAAVSATLAHVLDRDSALPFKKKEKGA